MDDVTANMLTLQVKEMDDRMTRLEKSVKDINDLVGACKNRRGISSSHLNHMQCQVTQRQRFVATHVWLIDPLLAAVAELKTKLDKHEAMRVQVVEIVEEYNDGHITGLNKVKKRVNEVEEFVQSNENLIISLTSSASEEINKLKLKVTTLDDKEGSTPIASHISTMIQRVSDTEAELTQSFNEDMEEFNALMEGCQAVSSSNNISFEE